MRTRHCQSEASDLPALITAPFRPVAAPPFGLGERPLEHVQLDGQYPFEVAASELSRHLSGFSPHWVARWSLNCLS